MGGGFKNFLKRLKFKMIQSYWRVGGEVKPRGEFVQKFPVFGQEMLVKATEMSASFSINLIYFVPAHFV